ncbi:MAG: PorV/PorQ family protein [Bacteroidota bacterium]
MKKLLIIILLASISIPAQTAGNSGLSFLKLGFGARNIAMGDLGVIGSNDLTALNYNPALLADSNKAQIFFTHNSLFEDLSSEMFAGSFTLFGMPVAIGVNTTNISNIEVRTKPGEAESTFDAHYFNASISTAYNISENIFIGASAKYIYESLFVDDATGMGFDFGAAYKNVIENLSLGISLRNIGSLNSLRNESTKLPTDLRIGAEYKFELPESKFNFTALGGFQKYTDTDDTHLHFGAEVIYDKMFSLRGGYITGYDSKDLSAGFGVLWNNISIDYAYVPVNYSLGDYHIISIMYTFNN